MQTVRDNFLCAARGQVSGEVLEAVQLDKALMARIRAREFAEQTYAYLLKYLDTLPEFDKVRYFR